MNAPTRPATRSWWSPAGWTQAPGPDAYENALFGENDSCLDWPGELKVAGYTREGPQSPEGVEYSASGEICIFRHTDHLAVEIWDTNVTTALFFVAAGDVAAFRATLLPPMLQAMAAVWQAEELHDIRRALAACTKPGKRGA